MLIADEPTSSLDYESEGKVLELLGRSQELHGFAMVLISHDILKLTEFCSEIAVMSAGKIVEFGQTNKIVENPKTLAAAELSAAMTI